MNFSSAGYKSISKYLHLQKISDFEKTSQRNNYIWNRGYYAEGDCRTAELFIY